MNAAKIKATISLADWLRNRGFQLRPSGKEFVTDACPITKHKKPNHRPVSINPKKEVWFCNDCEKGGSVIDWVMREDGVTAADAMRILGGNSSHAVISETYDYTDAKGKLVYQICRLEPKDFRARRPNGRGGWIWGKGDAQSVLYHLPAVIASQEVCVPEGEKDADNLMRLGFVATTNPFGAGKWTKGHSQTLRGKDVVIFGDIGDADGKGEKHTALRIRELTGVAKLIKNVSLPDGFHDVSDYIASLPAKEASRIIRDLIDKTPKLGVKSVPAVDKPESLIESIIDRGKQPVYLPVCGHLLSEFADKLGSELKDCGFYQRGGHVFIVNERCDGFERVTAQMFRTLAEKYVVCLKGTRRGNNVSYSQDSMTEDNARGVLEAKQFLERLQKVRRIHTARLPVLRRNGKIELLPVGYDSESLTLTLPRCEYQTDLSLEDARQVIENLLCEFPFQDDDGRSKSVSISAIVGIYAAPLLDPHFQRPVFFYAANAEGAGKTLLAKCAVAPTHGIARIDSAIREKAEMDKELLAAVMAGRSYFIFDNCKGHINSAHLEAFASSALYSGRILGVSRLFEGENLISVLITGNSATTTPDLRRRSLQVDLFTEAERAEDRVFQNILNDAVLLDLRPKILAALWAFVREWDKAGRPHPSRSHSAFPEWADTIGGIVEKVGKYACPLNTPVITAAIDPDGADMRETVYFILKRDAKQIKFDELVSLAREHGLFQRIIPTDDDETLTPSQKSALGKLLKRYDRRVFNLGELLKRYDRRVFNLGEIAYRFVIDGKGRSRSFRVVHQTQNAQVA